MSFASTDLEAFEPNAYDLVIKRVENRGGFNSEFMIEGSKQLMFSL